MPDKVPTAAAEQDAVREGCCGPDYKGALSGGRKAYFRFGG